VCIMLLTLLPADTGVLAYVVTEICYSAAAIERVRESNGETRFTRRVGTLVVMLHVVVSRLPPKPASSSSSSSRLLMKRSPQSFNHSTTHTHALPPPHVAISYYLLTYLRNSSCSLLSCISAVYLGLCVIKIVTHDSV